MYRLFQIKNRIMDELIPTPAADRHPAKYATSSDPSAPSKIFTNGSTYPLHMPPINLRTGELNPDWYGQYLVDATLHAAGSDCLAEKGITSDLTPRQASENRAQFAKAYLWGALQCHKGNSVRAHLNGNRLLNETPGLTDHRWTFHDYKGMAVWCKVIIDHSAVAARTPARVPPWLLALHTCPWANDPEFREISFPITYDDSGAFIPAAEGASEQCTAVNFYRRLLRFANGAAKTHEELRFAEDTAVTDELTEDFERFLGELDLDDEDDE